MIEIKYNTIEIGASGTITGKLYIELNGMVYPEKEWNDFIIVNLIQWIGEILEIKNELNLYFYDGNLCLTILKENDAFHEAKTYESFDLPLFIRDLMYHSNKILRDYREQLNDNIDYQRLNDLLNRLRLISKKLDSTIDTPS